MKLLKFGLIVIAVFFLSSCDSSEGFKNGKYEKEIEVNTYQLTQTYTVEDIKPFEDSIFKAKNIILLIGDGMGVSHVFSVMTANKDNSYFQKFDNIGFSKTASFNKYTTDSAAGGTAISTGHKTNNGAIAVDENNKPVKTILEIAEDNGLATGLVSTSSITHATPASFIAHQPQRNMYEEIAADFINTDIDVFIGGGMDNFLKREDGINLVEKLIDNGYSVIDNFEEVKTFEGEKLAGLIYDGHPKGIVERGEMLVPATAKAISLLNRNNKGFFLMIEGSQIDWAAHGNNTKNLIEETAEFDRVVGEALKFAEKDGNTLVIVTSDHETGGFAVKSGSSTEGKVKGQFTTGGHTATMVPVFAYGPGADKFRGIYENTDIFYKMLSSFGIE